MGKGKKGGKRMNKAQLTEKLHDFFASQPSMILLTCASVKWV